jgi:hypothetical protein
MPGICGRWPLRAGCRSPGFRRSRPGSCGGCCSCTGTCVRSTPPGPSGFTPRCSTRGCPAWPGGWPTLRSGPGCRGTARSWGCRRLVCRPSRWRWPGWKTWKPRSRRCTPRSPAFARRQPGCKALARELFGVWPLVAAIVWAFLGDTRRFSSSAQAVRHTGLDVTVYSSDAKRAPGHLSHQGPPILRWALFEAGHQGSRRAPGLTCHLSRPPLLHRRRHAHRCQPGRAAGRPQAGPPLPPHPAPARRPGLYPRAGLVRQMRVNAAALTKPMHRGHPRDRRPALFLPPVPCHGTHWTASKDRRGHTPSGTTPSIIMSPRSASTVSRTEIRPGARATRISRNCELALEEPMT